MTNNEILYRTLGYVHFNYLEKLCKKELLTGLPNNIESDSLMCVTSIECKIEQYFFVNNGIES